MALKLVDAFAGIGGFHLGFKDYAETVAAIEWNADCRQTYVDNHGLEVRWKDITKIDFSELPPHDILTGGFPCQAFSRNGKWFDRDFVVDAAKDNRAHLFLNLCGILNAHQPSYFVFENVKGILGAKNPDGTLYVDQVLRATRACGYEVDMGILSPHGFGIPQKRERVFFVGIREDLRRTFTWPVASQAPICLSDFSDAAERPQDLIEIIWANRKVLQSVKREQRFNRKILDYPAGTPRLEALRGIYAENLPNLPTAPTMKITPAAIIYGDTPSGGPRQQDKIYSRWGLCPTLTTFELTVPCFDFESGWRRLSPREAARLQGFPADFRLPADDGLAYHQVGNSVCVRVVKEIAEYLLTDANKHETIAQQPTHHKESNEKSI